jgi:DnaJ family protein C protein 28
MNFFEWIAEQKIQKAIEEGEFDGLNGYGKPLDLTENPFEPVDQRLAFHILKNSGYSLPWLERKAEIDRVLEAFRRNLRRYLHEPGNDGPAGDLRERLEGELEKINRLIFDYNLSIPLDSLHRPLLDLNREIQDACVTSE